MYNPQKMTKIAKRLPLALFLLRLGVFIVMAVWVADKFVKPEHAARVFEKFYFIGGLGNTAVYAIGVVQLAFVVGFVVGFQPQITYLAVFVMHAISTLSSFSKYLNPFEVPNLLFFAAWPMLAACFVLYYLRDADIKWTVRRSKLF